MSGVPNRRRGVGIVGCGRMGQRHAEALAASDVFTIVSVCDVEVETAARLAERMGVAIDTDLGAMLARPQVQVVAICTPTIHHAAQVRLALEAGRDVFCEKPLAPSEADVAALDEVVARTGRRVRTGYLYRHAPAFVRMHDLVMGGAIGQPHLAVFRIGGRGSHRAWKHTAEMAGGAMFDMMSHMVDLAVWLFGPAEQVRLLSRAILLPEREIAGQHLWVDAEDYVVAEWLADGVRCLVEADLASPSFMQYAEVHGSGGSIFGSIVDDLPTVVHLTQAHDGLAAGTQAFIEPRTSPMDEQWAAFARELEADGSDRSLADNRATTVILETLRLAS
jgi:predicted dehydrogenase